MPKFKFKLLVLFALLKAALTENPIDPNDPFQLHFDLSNELSITNFLSTINPNATLKLRFDTGYHLNQLQFNKKTNVWTTQGQAQMPLKIAAKRVRNSKQLVHELDVLWQFENSYHHENLCFVNTTNQKWLLYNLKGNGQFEDPLIFVTNEASPFSPALELIFYHKDGFALILDDLNPWFSINFIKTKEKEEEKICFSLKQMHILNSKTSIEHEKQYFSMKFKVIMAANLQIVHQFLNKAGYLKRPKSVKSTEMFNYYVMPTSMFNQNANGLFSMKIDSDTLLSKQPKMSDRHVHLHIDGPWSTVTDEFEFNKFQFENWNETIEAIHAVGNQVSVYVNPFILSSSTHYKAMKDYLVNTPKNSSTNVLDLSASVAFEWFSSKLANFTTTHQIDGLFCEKGDLNAFTTVSFESIVGDEMYQKYPNFISTRFCEACSSSAAKNIFTKTAYKSQEIQQIMAVSTGEGIDFDDKNSNTDELEKLFNKVLHLSLSGYPFILPQMTTQKSKPTMEWASLWIQLAAFMPVMQMPILLNESMYLQVKQGLKIIMKLRQTTLKSKYLELTENWIKTGEPIIRPLWYVFPDDPKALDIDNQFMIGNDIMIAPIFNVATEERTVYFPAGYWSQPVSINSNSIFTSANNNKTFTFNIGINNELPYFVKV